MKKFKLISETGSDKFEAELEKWLQENSEADIQSISHSITEINVQLSNTQSMRGLEYSALIYYIEKDKRDVDFGWDDKMV